MCFLNNMSVSQSVYQTITRYSGWSRLYMFFFFFVFFFFVYLIILDGHKSSAIARRVFCLLFFFFSYLPFLLSLLKSTLAPPTFLGFERYVFLSGVEQQFVARDVLCIPSPLLRLFLAVFSRFRLCCSFAL